MTAKVNLIGQRFGRLLVLKELPKKMGDTSPRWLCKCDCGSILETCSSNLRGGKQSCGCRKQRAKVEPVCDLPKEKRMYCPFPAGSCKKNKNGKCCWDCKEYENCPDACLNSPAKCGYLSK